MTGILPGGSDTRGYRDLMRTTAGVLLLLVLSACSATGRSDPPPARSTHSTTPSSASAGQTPSEDPEPDAPGPEAAEPLVVVANARSAPTDLTLREARRIVDGRVERASPLGRLTAELGVQVLPASEVGPDVRVVTVDGVHPLREPDVYPLRTEGPTPGRVTTLTVVGDIMLGRRVASTASARGDLSHPLRPMQRRLASADITVGNLESTLAVLGPPTQDDAFAADPAVRRGLRAAGFDALSLANNHSGDFGEASLLRTVELLEAANLRPFGAGADLAAARRPVVVTRHGVRFGFLGFNAIGETPEAGRGQPGAVSVSMPPRTGPLDRAELRRVLDDVRRLARRVDVVTVLPHWGTQYTERPEPVQGQVARQLVRAGADLVVGGHPHWVQGASLTRGALVVHSLGNFVFDMDFFEETMEGLVLEATFWDDELKAVDFVPYRMGSDFAPRVVAHDQAQRIFANFWRFSGLGSTTPTERVPPSGAGQD